MFSGGDQCRAVVNLFMREVYGRPDARTQEQSYDSHSEPQWERISGKAEYSE